MYCSILIFNQHESIENDMLTHGNRELGRWLSILWERMREREKEEESRLMSNTEKDLQVMLSVNISPLQ